jgi:hypothetical protein
MSEERKFQDGDRVTCKIEGKQIDDAKIAICMSRGTRYFYVCQNVRSGIGATDLKGYKYSYESDSSYDGKLSSKFGSNLTDLKLANVNPYSYGDILVHNSYSRGVKVLGVLDDVVFLSSRSDHEYSDGVFHYKELEGKYTLETPEPESIEINGKKYKREDVDERLKELKEVE